MPSERHREIHSSRYYVADANSGLFLFTNNLEILNDEILVRRADNTGIILMLWVFVVERNLEYFCGYEQAYYVY